MKTKTCKYCGKIIEGYTDKQVSYLMMQHLLAKHRELIFSEKDLCRGDKNDQNGTALTPNSQCSESKSTGEQSSPNTPTNLMEVNDRD